MVATIGVAVFFVIVFLVYLGIYNSLVNSLNSTDQSWSNVEVELKRRLDLIGNLVEVVKGYSKHEAETLVKVVEARNMRDSTLSAHNASQAQGEIKSTLGKLMAIAESYPDLKANHQFLNLQNELTNTENRIAERRHAYNQTVTFYQNLVRTIPSCWVASLHEAPKREFFDIPDSESTTIPSVSIR